MPVLFGKFHRGEPGELAISLYGSEFEIQLRNKLAQRAIAKVCAEWMRRKSTFKSNRIKAPMQ